MNNEKETKRHDQRNDTKKRKQACEVLWLWFPLSFRCRFEQFSLCSFSSFRTVCPLFSFRCVRCFVSPRCLVVQRFAIKISESRYGSFPFVSQPHGSESDYQNVEFLTFINPEHVIYDIGTEIIMFHCFATKMLKSFCKSIIFSGIESSRRDLAFYSIKTRFKALFKK